VVLCSPVHPLKLPKGQKPQKLKLTEGQRFAVAVLIVLLISAIGSAFAAWYLVHEYLR